MQPPRHPLQPYSTTTATLCGTALNGLLLYAMTSEGRIKGLALAALGSLSMNLTHWALKESGNRKSPFHSIHPLWKEPSFNLAEFWIPKSTSPTEHDRFYYEARRDMQLTIASLISATALTLFNHFFLKAPGMGMKQAFALSMVPALFSRSVQIRYDWQENHHAWGMSNRESQPIYPYDRPPRA